MLSISGGYRYGQAGGKGESFVNYPLPANSSIYWQVIAPDTSYGFQACDGDSVEKVFGMTDQVLKPVK